MDRYLLSTGKVKIDFFFLQYGCYELSSLCKLFCIHLTWQKIHVIRVSSHMMK